MSLRTVSCLFLATLAFPLGTDSTGQQGADQQGTPPTHEEVAAVESFLFVQNCTAGSFDGKRLTLHTVAPTIFFSDRPYRIFGHVQPAAFVEAWTRGPNSFAEDPPNAILSLIGESHVDSFMVELSDPRFENGNLSYAAVVESGEIPATFQESSLFIDNEAWAAVGGFALGHMAERRRTEREAAAYAAGKASKPATTTQTSTYYCNAAPPPPPPVPAPPASQPSVAGLLDQATTAMEAYANTASAESKQYIEQLVQTVKTVSADYTKVAK